MTIAKLILLFALQAGFAIALCDAAADKSNELLAGNEESVIAPLPSIVIEQERLTGEKLRQLLAQGSTHLINVQVDGDVRIGRRDAEPTMLRANDVTFNGDFWISDPHLDLRFDGVRFRGNVDLYGNKLRSFDCIRCRFDLDANFHSVEFQSTHLASSRFTGDAVFANAQLGDIVLTDAVFSGRVDFIGASMDSFVGARIRTKNPILIDWAQFGDALLKHSAMWIGVVDDPRERRSRVVQTESQLLFWKRNFEALRNELDAREANFAAIELRRTHLLNLTDVEYWASVILELPNRFGTRPYRPLWISVVVIVLFAVVYWIKNPFTWQDGHEVSGRFRPVYALLYSLDTFIPLVDITGVKDWGCTLSQQFRGLELAQRLLGFVLTSLAAYSVGSYLF